MGWLPYLIYPGTPIFHAAWWHHNEGGRAFVKGMETNLIGIIDEEEIISPLVVEDEGLPVWPWERWFAAGSDRKGRKPKRSKLQSGKSKNKKNNNNNAPEDDFSIMKNTDSSSDEDDDNDDVDDDEMQNENDISSHLISSTPQWQRYYEKGTEKIERIVQSRTVVMCSVHTQTDADEEKTLAVRLSAGSGSSGSSLSSQQPLASESQILPPTTAAALLQPSRPLTILEQLNLPELEDWKNLPIFARFNDANHLSTKHKLTPNTPNVKVNRKTGIPINRLGPMGFVKFETKLFVGKFSLAIADLEDSEMAHIFAGKKRRYRYVVSGRFKERLPMKSVYTGQVIKEMNPNSGNKWLMKSMRWMLKSLSPAMKETVDGEGNKIVMCPVVATAQRLSIKNVGDKSAMNFNCDAVEEDCLFLGENFAARNKPTVSISSELRKKLMCGKELDKHYFETDKEYTFEFYNHLFDPKSFHMNLAGLSTLDVVSVIGQQPIRLMAKLFDRDDYLWDLELWNSRVFEKKK